MSTPETRAAPDVPTQPPVPSESAGTQTAAGSPSEQPEAAIAVPPGVPTEDPTVTASEPESSTPAEPGSTTSDATASQSGNEPEPQPVDSAGQPIAAEGNVPDGSLPAPVSPPRPSGVGVDGAVFRGRDDNDAVTDRFCQVVSGPYAGRYGVYLSTASLGTDGWPETIVVRTRDAEDENLVVNYSDCRPSVPGKR
jgi:hypothetical protein